MNSFLLLCLLSLAAPVPLPREPVLERFVDGKDIVLDLYASGYILRYEGGQMWGSWNRDREGDLNIMYKHEGKKYALWSLTKQKDGTWKTYPDSITLRSIYRLPAVSPNIRP